jgi:DNA-directed RNA polymerase subunit RPC12/RpoP
MGFLDDYPGIDNKPKARPRVVFVPEPENVTVEYVTTKCPFCKSKRVPVYNSEHLPIRYHKCLDCKKNFKSIEK